MLDEYVQIFEYGLIVLLTLEILLHLICGHMMLLVHHLLHGPGLTNDRDLIFFSHVL